MALRNPRIAIAGNSNAGMPGRTQPATPPPEAMPQVKPARPRDAMAQDRLRQLAAERAEQKAQSETTACQRRARRKQTALPGLLTFTTMRLQVPCTIADMSGSGARLKLPAATAQSYGDLEHLPDRLTLVLRADRMQIECEVKWRKPGGLGVRFLGPPTPLPRTQR